MKRPQIASQKKKIKKSKKIVKKWLTHKNIYANITFAARVAGNFEKALYNFERKIHTKISKKLKKTIDRK